MSKVPDNCKNICNYAYPNLAIIQCLDFQKKDKCMKNIIDNHYKCTRCLNKTIKRKKIKIKFI